MFPWRNRMVLLTSSMWTSKFAWMKKEVLIDAKSALIVLGKAELSKSIFVMTVYHLFKQKEISES